MLWVAAVIITAASIKLFAIVYIAIEHLRRRRAAKARHRRAAMQDDV